MTAIVADSDTLAVCMPPVTFTSEVHKSPVKGGWTYLTWDKSAAFFATRGRVKVRGTFDGHPFETSFMALGNGMHKLPITAAALHSINKDVGDTVRVIIKERC